MRTTRVFIWGSAIIVGGDLLLLARVGVFPEWLVVGPVCLGVAGVALLADQVVCAPGRRGVFLVSLLMIALSAGTVAQDAGLVIDNWAVWPFVAGALCVGLPLELLAAHRRHTRPSPGAHAAWETPPKLSVNHRTERRRARGSRGPALGPGGRRGGSGVGAT
jgi:hypothetical protein